MVDHIMMYSENCFRTFYETISLIKGINLYRNSYAGSGEMGAPKK